MLQRLAQHFRQAIGDEPRQRLRTRLESGLESQVDKALFACQACGGHCLLFETAFICPLTCTRGLRNGPCRGSTPDHCCIDRTRKCVWYRIFGKAERQGTLERLLEVNAPFATRCRGLGTPTAHGCGRQQGRGPRLIDLILNPARYYSEWETYHNGQRQLPWWQGDSRYHPPAYTEPASRLESRLRGGQFVVSVEVAPPMEPSGSRIAQLAEQLEGSADTFNFTDNPRGVARMSALSCAIHSLANGVEPVLQIQTR